MNEFISNIIGSLKNLINNDVIKNIIQNQILSGNGIQNLLQQADKVGLGDKVRSWIGNGINLPISGAEIGKILSSSQIRNLAEKAGIPVATITTILASVLPDLVNKYVQAPKEEISENSDQDKNL